MYKMYFVVVPEKLAGHVAKFLFENEMKVLLSYSKEAFVNGNQVCVHVGVPEGEKEKLFTAEFKNYIK